MTSQGSDQQSLGPIGRPALTLMLPDLRTNPSIANLSHQAPKICSGLRRITMKMQTGEISDLDQMFTLRRESRIRKALELKGILIRTMTGYETTRRLFPMASAPDDSYRIAPTRELRVPTIPETPKDNG